ncbi:MAG: PP2C family protein-serine/threonine phosphatase [Thermoguttaceae bacterium]
MSQILTRDIEVERLRLRVEKLQRELQSRRTDAQRRLELAAKVHRSLLPRPVRDRRICVDLRYSPIEEVGGDYCQVRFADPDTLFITICDVTGHGMGPALLATRVSSEVRYGILYGRDPYAIVRSLNTFICDHFDETHLYLSFVAARLDLSTLRLTWCGAGHPSPLLIRRNRPAVEPLTSQNTLIGVRKDLLEDPIQQTVELDPGDRLVFYTDGVTETDVSDGRQLGINGLAEMAADAMSVDLFAMADHILERIEADQQGPTLDDKTLIVAEVK